MINDILCYFEYRDNDLFIVKKWACCVQLNKKVYKKVLINKITYKKEEIIWAIFGNDIPEGKVIKFKIKNDYSIDNLYLGDYEYANGRPRGSGDKKKRIVKKVLSSKDERYIRENWGKFSIKELSKKFKVSKSTIISVKNRFNIDPRKSIYNIFKFKIDVSKHINLSGVYGIITKDGRSYIGSSVNVLKRIKVHLKDLNNNKHINKSLQKSWCESSYFVFIEKCDEFNLLEREDYYIKNISKLHNINKTNNHNKEYYSKAYEKIKNNINIIENDCWEYNGHINGTGYKNIKILNKTIPTHRVMFYFKNPKISQNMIIRHKCNNKSCCNPDHLEYGSIRDNALDIKKEEMARFEIRYKETRGDIVLLCKEFNIKERTVKSRIYSMKLISKYGKAKRKQMSVKEVDKNTQIPSL